MFKVQINFCNKIITCNNSLVSRLLELNQKTIGVCHRFLNLSKSLFYKLRFPWEVAKLIVYRFQIALFQLSFSVIKLLS